MRSPRARRGARARPFATLLVIASLAVPAAEPTDVPVPPPAQHASPFFSPDDGQLDVSGFLDEKYGFLPIVMPITEPAVGYGAAGALAFISKPLGQAMAGLGRPNVTVVGGMGTENGSWGALAGDLRYWMDDRLQTLAGVLDASVNLDFHGIGDDARLHDDPLRYTLHPVGGMLQGKYRIGDSLVWAGLAYAYATTTVSFEAPPATPGLPDYQRRSDVGGVTPSVTWDSRDNIFTPLRGSYVELGAGVFGPYFGADDEFQRVRLIGMHYRPLADGLYLGVRGEFAASFGDAPFYLRPFINLRGVPVMRYQGQEMAQLEAELRWQFSGRWSVLGFVGTGVAWNDFVHLDESQAVVSGGGGFRYELARRYGIHAGLDLAFSGDDTAVYVQVGSAWARP